VTLAVIASFFWLQMQIEQAMQGGVRMLLLSLTVLLEGSLLVLWNALTSRRMPSLFVLHAIAPNPYRRLASIGCIILCHHFGCLLLDSGRVTVTLPANRVKWNNGFD
jgi:hypothetical protein